MFTRASPATYFDSSGTLQYVGNDVPRYGYDPTTLASLGLLIEAESINKIFNPRFEGGVNGTPGTVPTSMSISLGAGVTQQLAFGTDSGIPYMDFICGGTTAGAVQTTIALSVNSNILCSQNQIASQAVYTKLQAGSLTNVSLIELSFTTKTSGGGYLNDYGGGNITPTTAELRTQRKTNLNKTLADATIGQVLFQIYINHAAGAQSFTFRLGGPQLEFGATISSLILPVIGTANAATTRAADVGTPDIAFGWFTPTVSF